MSKSEILDVVACMRGSAGDAATQLDGLIALFGAVAEGRAESVLAAGSIEAAVAAMTAHKGVADVQEQGCKALGFIVFQTEDKAVAKIAALAKIAAAGGIEATVAAMNAHIDVTGVQLQGCMTLWHIAAAPGNQAKVTAAGGIEVVVAAMNAHRGVADIQEMGCKVLYVIATATENKVKVAAVGGIEAIVVAMNAHRGVAGIQDSG